MHAPTLLFFLFPFVFSWGIAAMLFIPYFLPTIIAFIRRSSSAAGIFLLNLFLGWTFIGWIISLVWAIASRNTSTTVIVNNTYANNSPSYNNPPSHKTSPTIRRPNQS